MDNAKYFWQSKIFWVAMIQTLIATLSLVGDFLQKSDFSPVAITSLVSGVLVIVLRIWFTDSPVALKK